MYDAMGVAVIGGGLSGISAALDLANLGFTVYLIEKSPVLGGKACELAECKVGLSSWIAEVENQPNIELLLSSEIADLSGSAGSFKLKVSGKEIEVASIVLAPGYDVFEDISASYAIGHPDVVSSLEFEHLLKATTKAGELVRPSNGQRVRRIGFIQCVGSRCAENELCSTVCCAYTAKEAKMVKKRFPDVEVYVFYMDLRVFGKDEELVEEITQQYDVRYVRSRVPAVMPKEGCLNVKYENLAKGTVEDLDLDMVVLAVGLLPSRATGKLAEMAGLQTDKYGYFETSFIRPLETNIPGIFVCGTANAPMNVSESVAQGSAAAIKASALSERNGRIAEHAREFSDAEDDPRVGVFICGCEGAIGDFVDIPAVVERVKNLRNVVYVTGELKTCEDAKNAIAQGITDLSLNRVVFAGCTPRGHENMFRATCAEAGLNPSLLDFANIREHCAWVHGKEEATEVAENLITMAVNGLRHLGGHAIELYPVIPAALVIGGGVSGMTAALEIANAGHEVYLVEKEPELGGLLSKITELQTGEKAAAVLKVLTEQIRGNARVKVYTNAEVEDVRGRPGEFRARIVGEEVDEEIEFGAVVLATGAEEFEPTGYYGYGEAKKVVTQLEFEKMLEGEFGAKTTVMIQCVGREEAANQCSKVCCVEAVKNAIRALKKNPKLNIYVLYRDLVTYGVWELLYREARERGVIFIRYDKARPPQFDEGIVSVHDALLSDELLIKPDLIVLSTPMLPPAGNEKMSALLSIPLADNGFFSVALERPKLRLSAVETPNKGVFICGSAIYPAMLNECIVQAGAAASRACNLLSKDYIVAEPITASVDETLCRGCGLCAKACEYGAVTLKESKGMVVAEVDGVLCRGCGACAVSCPSRAVRWKRFTIEQLISMIDAVA